jgi:apolipoprotein N-acyltransferase
MPLANSQANFTLVLQPLQYLGPLALSAFIAFVNIGLYQTLKQMFESRKRLNKPALRTLSSITIVVCLWFALSLLLLKSWNQKLESWESLSVGIVQPNENAALGKPQRFAGYSLAYPPEMEMTERLSQVSADDALDLVIWPESRHKHYFDNEYVQNAYKRLVKQSETNLLFQDFQNLSDFNQSSQFNAATMINSEGEQPIIYQKIKRIPFGEYLPLMSEGTWLRELFENYLGEFLNELSAGEKYVAFEHDKLNIVPLICYETTFSEFVAGAIQTSHDNNSSKSTL